MAATLLVRPAPLRAYRCTRPAFTAFSTRRTESTLRSLLVTASELSEALKSNAPSKLSTAPRVIPVCGSWFLPNDPQKRSGYDVYKKGHIKDARFFDMDKVSDTTSPYPHMLPSPEVFRDSMRQLGIKRDDTVVVYDSAELGIFSAPRVAWTFRVFGHSAVHILNNFKIWVDQGYPVEEGEQQTIEETQYPTPELDRSRVIAFEDVEIAVFDHNKEGSEQVQVVDARPAGRWKGTDPEPRPGLSSGHMPGSISVPFTELLDPNTKALLPPDELRKVLDGMNVDPNKPIISSCGTGVTAAIIDTALIEAGYDNGKRQLYDGSWTEWAQRVQTTDNLIVKSE